MGGVPINSQNLPRDGIRRLFVAPEGYEIFKADYNQLELRVLTESGQVTKLIDAYLSHDDIHTSSALEIIEPVLLRFNGPAYETWMTWELKAKRYFGKNKLNFPSVYGVEAPKMVEMANKSYLPLALPEARAILREFDRRYPQIEQHRDEYQAVILAGAEAHTLYGRRRVFPGLANYSATERAAAAREGFNHRIQGTAADLFKLAWLALWQAGLLDEHHTVRNVVHDEFVGYIPEGDYGWCTAAKEVLESVTRWQPFPEWPMHDWSVPLEVEFAVGQNWYDAIPLDDLLKEAA